MVSVIIPAYNSARWIAATLESVRAQKRENVEVIVVDDGSADGTAELVEREFPEVNLVRTPNRGASQARNLGTSLARGEFIQYLDADDLLVAGKINAQVDALERTGADVAYGDWQKLMPSPEAFVLGEVVARAIEGDPEIALFLDFWCPPAAYLFRRDIVDRVGGWNLGLPVIQDARFALDCALRGGKFVYCQGLMAHYRVHQGDSLSRQSPIAFNRDCYRNAQDVEAWWRDHGGVYPTRRRALTRCYSQVARAAHAHDPETFEAVCSDLERLQPGYTPEGPPHLRLVSKILGYRRAENVAARYRRMKESVLRGASITRA
jgi:glycosyltransferase involved in cell wall biosynthesis